METYDPDLINRLIEKADAICEANKKTADAVNQLSTQIVQIQKQVNEIVRKLTVKGLLN